MIASKILPVAFLALALSEGHAHGLWIESSKEGYKVFFGEPDHGIREKKDKLQKFAGLKAWKTDGSETKTELKEDHFLIAGDSAGVVAVNQTSPVRERPEGNTKSNQYLRFASDIDKPGKPSKHMFLDIVPEGNGLRLKVLKDGKPVEETKLVVLAPNGWSKTYEADKIGGVQIQAPWPGLYVVKATWEDKTPGEFGGKKYGAANHSSTLTFVKPGN